MRPKRTPDQRAFAFREAPPVEWVYTCPYYASPKPEWFAHPVLKATAKRLYVSQRSILARNIDTGRGRGGHPGDPYRLNRGLLEWQGWVRHGRKRDSAFYLRPGMERVPSPEELWKEQRRAREAREREFEARKAADPGAWAERQRRAAEATRKAIDDLEEQIRRLMAREQAPRLADALTLGLSLPCSPGEIRAAYRRLALRTHPDRGGSAEAFRRINEAYERLMKTAAAPT
jgi:hypothetical protein